MGKKITARLLRLCGWNISEHIDFSCGAGKKHIIPGTPAKPIKGPHKHISPDRSNTPSTKHTAAPIICPKDRVFVKSSGCGLGTGISVVSPEV